MTPSAIHSIQRDVQRLGIKLSEARRRRRMSQRAMADQTGMSLSTVRRLERGEPGVAIHALLSGFKVLEILDACIGLLSLGEDDVDQGRAAELLPKRVRQPKAGRDISAPMRRGSFDVGSPAPAAEFGAGVAQPTEAISLQPQLPVDEPKKQGRVAVVKPRQSHSQGQIDLFSL
ncbi:helix-turn-helix domain-containing protein [Hydrogenophaga sp. BPS33]|uniref:helix-turn-helix domain-containing protein n=1 Tax=Hydrogenophaga sp. BPS33 TaxID=2651974 RepID=UPI00131F4956|nr:helix-turn-helix transcriptional regulator [Hydrogenophaga sp. BPS33]QHE84746.1 helix-turn-helix transcriptional regulator [Hydrogenophaga sp. BPS33]